MAARELQRTGGSRNLSPVLSERDSTKTCSRGSKRNTGLYWLLPGSGSVQENEPDAF